MCHLLMFPILWFGVGPCRLPFHLWPEEASLQELVAFANEPLPCSSLVDAGKNQSGFQGDRFVLKGRLLEPPPEPFNLEWRQVSGPDILIATPHALETTFEAFESGTYVFDLEVFSKGWYASDRVSILVTKAKAAVTGLRAELVATGLDIPVQILAAPGEGQQLFIVEQRGKVKLLLNGELQETPFLDLDPDPGNPVLWDCYECGMLGMVLDPDFLTNGLFYLSFTGKVTPEEDPVSGSRMDVTRVFVYRMMEAEGLPVFERKLLLSIPQPFRNHHGGQMAFGPDGMFYIALGDSSPCGDPENHAQDMNLLLGKVLRLQTNGFAALSVPADNPFVGLPGVRPEIWASGLRNPWRWSFDALTGDMYLGDVGQETWEEINWLPFGAGGENLGWRIREGFECFLPRDVCGETPMCPQPGLTDPVFAYAHSTTQCAVIGGYVYRSEHFQHLQGRYLFGDFCSSKMQTLVRETSTWSHASLQISTPGTSLNGGLLNLAAGPDGDLYFSTRDQLFRVVMIQASE